MVAPTETQMDFRLLTEKDNHHDFTVPPGCIIYVILPESPGSTGHRWVYEPSMGPPEDLVTPDFDRYTAGVDGSRGAPGAHLFAFRVHRPGVEGRDRDVLQFADVAPDGGPAEKVLNFRLHVTDRP